MDLQKKNIFQNLPSDLPDEVFEIIQETSNLRIERIISRGHVSQGGYWYDQDWHEWVILLAGYAKIEFEDPRETVELTPGDYVQIPMHCRHRVIETSTEKEAIWLAVSYNSEDSNS